MADKIVRDVEWVENDFHEWVLEDHAEQVCLLRGTSALSPEERDMIAKVLNAQVEAQSTTLPMADCPPWCNICFSFHGPEKKLCHPGMNIPLGQPKVEENEQLGVAQDEDDPGDGAMPIETLVAMDALCDAEPDIPTEPSTPNKE